MAEILPIESVPPPLVGEQASIAGVYLLAAIGAAMAIAVAWLLESPETLRPDNGLSESQVARVGNVDTQRQDNEASNAITLQSATIATSQSVEKSARDFKPTCPEGVTINFRFGKAVPIQRINPGEFASQVEWAQKSSTAKLVVEGHADSVGMDEANVLLSYTRAKYVADILMSQGAAAQQIQIAASGSHAPIEGIPADADENRRATLRINDPEGCKTGTD
jgi:outer membrane protein OmpA-like peptidoglycan-associated protein